MRIAHLSDLHLCSTFKNNNYARLNNLIENALDNGTDHFVFSGDIADNADETEFSAFRKLLDNFGLLDADRSSIVIGNHDIFGGPQTANDVITFPVKCLNINYHERVSRFVTYFRELFDRTIRPGADVYFPFIKKMKDVVFFGLNSIDEYSRFKNPFASNGRIKKTQRKFLADYLSKPEFSEKTKIVLVHHHFYHNSDPSKSSANGLWNRIEKFTMKLKGKRKLLDLFYKSNIKAVLHGHSHEMREYHRKGINFLNAGATMDNNPSYFLIDVEPDVLKIKLQSTNNTGALKEYVNGFIPAEATKPAQIYFNSENALLHSSINRLVNR
ncbi:MAG TPA: metallophosphoesterase [Melioribacteraceae bacterium]|nr:metallophosphoesterase [Melioribacteraceae bacterium]